MASNAKYFVFKSRVMFIETLNKVIDIFNNREVYFDYEQVNLFNAPDIDDPEPYTYVVESNFEITKLGNKIEPKVYLISENKVTKNVCISSCEQDFNEIILSNRYVFKKGIDYVQHVTDDGFFIVDENGTRASKDIVDLLPIETMTSYCTLREGYERIITDNYEQILINK